MSFKARILYTVALLVIFHGTVEQAHAVCPTVAPMANFNAQNFLGSWYAIRRFSTLYNGFATSCIAMNSTFSNRNIYGLELCNLFSQRTPIKVLGTLLSNGVFKVKFQLSAINYEVNYVIVDTDYLNYAVTYFCFTAPLTPSVEVAWIYSRKRTLSEAYLTTATNALKAKNLNLKNFVDVIQSGCT